MFFIKVTRPHVLLARIAVVVNALNAKPFTAEVSFVPELLLASAAGEATPASPAHSAPLVHLLAFALREIQGELFATTSVAT